MAMLDRPATGFLWCGLSCEMSALATPAIHLCLTGSLARMRAEKSLAASCDAWLFLPHPPFSLPWVTRVFSLPCPVLPSEECFPCSGTTSSLTGTGAFCLPVAIVGFGGSGAPRLLC